MAKAGGNVIIVDSEYESCAATVGSVIAEVIELGQSFSKELLSLTENGLRDVLIDNEIINKSFKIYTAMLKLEEAAKDVPGSLKSFISEADATDAYLY
ncbi:hypothetical protein [Roseburia sp. MSJ-14]|uniref:hypothetical protein n=1 Tax=Roseburia sp. MSJ-14 TaxID=2841514 RepID=UPI001C0FFA3D|nr:hypothetical protein [Roseburia sp. MSJ-14]MBU5472037.1 hypothetical protein [Roseburia sp. MSJ-14]